MPKSNIPFEEKLALFQEAKKPKSIKEVAKPKRSGPGGRVATEWESHPLIAPVLESRRKNPGMGIPFMAVPDGMDNATAKGIAQTIKTRLEKVGSEARESWSVWVVEGNFVVSFNGKRGTRTRKASSVTTTNVNGK